ncbi:Uncharacterised protein [Mycobacteroides abscessus subsp. abscessus]|nr:Uncharacterised protein [Mycobacteroides abscessus subsp. abscessus]
MSCTKNVTTSLGWASIHSRTLIISGSHSVEPSSHSS